jgi:hypothetical protein
MIDGADSEILRNGRTLRCSSTCISNKIELMGKGAGGSRRAKTAPGRHTKMKMKDTNVPSKVAEWNHVILFSFEGAPHLLMIGFKRSKETAKPNSRDAED